MNSNSSNYCNAKPIKKPRNAEVRLFNDLISLFQSLNVNFIPMSVETLWRDWSRPFVIVCGTLTHIINTFLTAIVQS